MSRIKLLGMALVAAFALLGLTSVSALAAGPPIVETGEALPGSGVEIDEALLLGKVNPNGLATTYHFEYGITTSYGSDTHTEEAGSGTTSKTAAGDATVLEPETTYHYRLVASNTDGTTYGKDATVTTGKVTSGLYPAFDTQSKPESAGGSSKAELHFEAGSKAGFICHEGSSSTGQISTHYEMTDVVLTFYGCYSGSGYVTTPGQKAGTIVTKQLTGRLVQVSEGKSKVGIDLRSAEHGAFAEVSYFGTSAKLTGELVGEWEGTIGVETESLPFAFHLSSGGIQDPSEYSFLGSKASKRQLAIAFSSSEEKIAIEGTIAWPLTHSGTIEERKQ